MNIRKSLSLMIGFCLMVSPKTLAMNLNTTYSQDNKDINLLLGDATEIPKHVLKWACNAVLPNESIESIKLSDDKIIKVLKYIEQNFDKIPCSEITKNIKEYINVNPEETLDVIFKKILLIWDQRDSLDSIKKSKLNYLAYGLISYCVLKILDKPCSLELKIGQTLEWIPFLGEFKKVETYHFHPVYFLKGSDGSTYNSPYYLGQGSYTDPCKEKFLLLPEYLNEVSWNNVLTFTFSVKDKDYDYLSTDDKNENLLEILCKPIEKDFNVFKIMNDILAYISVKKVKLSCAHLYAVNGPLEIINRTSRDIYNSR